MICRRIKVGRVAELLFCNAPMVMLADLFVYLPSHCNFSVKMQTTVRRSFSGFLPNGSSQLKCLLQFSSTLDITDIHHAAA